MKILLAISLFMAPAYTGAQSSAKYLQEQYNDFADQYAAHYFEQNQSSIKAYYHFFDQDLHGLKILDLGCGDGQDLWMLGQRGAKLYGIDASQEMVQLAQQKNPTAEITLGLFENLPYEDNHFDWVISKWAIQTAPDIFPIYQQAYRVLKPGGQFVFLTGHPTRQFIEKKKHPKDYFKKEIVTSILFGGEVVVQEPSHTLNEYLSPYFLQHFTLVSYEEGVDAGAEKVDGDTYPIYAIFKAIKKAPA